MSALTAPTTCDVYKVFSQKSVFFTGATGFVGKVFLFKLLREFPDLASVFILVRPKKKQTPQQRVENEVLGSPCFGPLKEQLGEAEWRRRAAKVVGIAGDITDDRLGMSDADFARVTTETQFIIHLAATVDFQAPINVSANMNILGTLRVLALAEKCVKLETFVHTSTCYVNWNRHGHERVLERTYPLPFDPEAMTKYILSLHDSQADRVGKMLLKKYNFPNTYTFTKNVTEHILELRRGKIPLIIVRPAIIGCSWREPMPGWADALTAAGGLFLTAGLGIIKHVYNKGDVLVTDIIPVDHVVNIIIKAAAQNQVHYMSTRDSSAGAVGATPRVVAIGNAAATASPVGLVVGGKGAVPAVGGLLGPRGVAPSVATPSLTPTAADPGGPLHHEGAPSGPNFIIAAGTTGSANTFSWQLAKDVIPPYFNARPHPKRFGTAGVEFHDQKWKWRVYNFRDRVLPMHALQLVAALPIIGDDKKRELAKKYEKAVYRTIDMQEQFEPFTVFEWHFDHTHKNRLDIGIPKEQLCICPSDLKAQKDVAEKLGAAGRCGFNSDPYDISWHAYVTAYGYGLIKFIMKTDDGRGAPQLPASGAEAYLRASL